MDSSVLSLLTAGTSPPSVQFDRMSLPLFQPLRSPPRNSANEPLGRPLSTDFSFGAESLPSPNLQPFADNIPILSQVGRNPNTGGPINSNSKEKPQTIAVTKQPFLVIMTRTPVVSKSTSTKNEMKLNSNLNPVPNSARSSTTLNSSKHIKQGNSVNAVPGSFIAPSLVPPPQPQLQPQAPVPLPLQPPPLLQPNIQPNFSQQQSNRFVQYAKYNYILDGYPYQEVVLLPSPMSN